MGCGSSKRKKTGLKIVTPADAEARRKTMKSAAHAAVFAARQKPRLAGVASALMGSRATRNPPKGDGGGATSPVSLFSGKMKRESRYSWRTKNSAPAAMLVEPFTMPMWADLPLGDTVDLHDLPEGTAGLNRYKNILPNPNTRVLLSADDAGGDGQSYINANYIRGARLAPNEPSRPRCYIATQGPTHRTVGHFWRMVWQEQSTIIIMVTGLSEAGRSKCERYWPEADGAIEVAGIKITAGESTTRAGITLTKLDVSCMGESRVVHHFWHHEWPDHTKPLHTSSVGAVLQMVATVRQLRPTSEAPWVVHCSAGVGRSGTIITIDYGVDLLTSQAQCSVGWIIAELRQDRAGFGGSF
mmetsp:Transcript_23938/g.71450  ORF Transcript_23938/g.71450 Transcript_23938/m.71450 type:complete len:356 (+) Transcript_23938:313-1380(+)